MMIYVYYIKCCIKQDKYYINNVHINTETTCIFIKLDVFANKNKLIV